VRSLIYAPIVHSAADLGSMAGDFRSRFVEAFGAEAWERKVDLVAAMWEGLRAKLLVLPVDWRRVRLYQDGLPVCDVVDRIVADLAASGSRNHQLLLELQQRGATIMGTEDPEVLVREYRRLQRLVEAARGSGLPDAEAAEVEREGDALLRERDRFIARRIVATLGEDETGILFVGLLHRVDERLDGVIDVRAVIHSLPFGADLWRRLRKGNGDGG
jgi:hypothetical protein